MRRPHASADHSPHLAAVEESIDLRRMAAPLSSRRNRTAALVGGVDLLRLPTTHRIGSCRPNDTILHRMATLAESTQSVLLDHLDQAERATDPRRRWGGSGSPRSIHRLTGST